MSHNRTRFFDFRPDSRDWVQMPFEVWIAIDRTARRPKEPELPIRIVRFSGAALTQGVEKHQMEGVTIQGRHHAFWFQRPERNIWVFLASDHP